MYIEEFMSDCLLCILYYTALSLRISKNSKYKIINPADTGYVKLYLFNYGQFQSFNFQHTSNFKFILKDIFFNKYIIITKSNYKYLVTSWWLRALEECNRP